MDKRFSEYRRRKAFPFHLKSKPHTNLESSQILIASSLHVPEGTEMSLGLAHPHLEERFFGENPLEFNPTRFETLPQDHSKAKFPPWGIFSFLSGPKAWCVSRLYREILSLFPNSTFLLSISQHRIYLRHVRNEGFLD